MNANELRLGNLIWDCDENTFYPIEEIKKNTQANICVIYRNGSFMSIDINPIPITFKWLSKFGFIYDDNWHWQLGINPFTKDYLLDLCWIDGDEFPFYRNGFFKIKYIHQLQNLYFTLTGEELIIK
jgi:hypothetical protein